MTHGVTYLPEVDLIVVMKDGQISESGTYYELLTHNGEFAQFLGTYLNDDQAEDADTKGQVSFDKCIP